MALPQDIPFKSDFILEAPLAGIFKADLMAQQQQDAQLDMIKKQLENEKSAAMNPLEIRLKELGIPLSELKAAQARIQMSPENLQRYGDRLGYDYNEAQRADELAALGHPLYKRLAEIKQKYALGGGLDQQPSSGTIGFPTSVQASLAQAEPLTKRFVKEPTPADVAVSPSEVQATPRDTSYDIAEINRALASPNIPASARAELEGLKAQYQQTGTRGIADQPPPELGSATMAQVQQPVQQLQSAGQVAGLMNNPEAARIMEALMFDPKYMEKLGVAQAKNAGNSDKQRIAVMNLKVKTGQPFTAEEARIMGNDALAGQVLSNNTRSALVEERAANLANNFLQTANDVKNFVDSPEGSQLGIFSGLNGKDRDTVVTSLSGFMGRKLTPEADRTLQQAMSGFKVTMANVIGGGFASASSKGRMEALADQLPREGDEPSAKLVWLARVKQELHAAAETYATRQSATKEQKEMVASAINEIDKLIPWGMDEVNASLRKKTGQGTTGGAGQREYGGKSASELPPGFKPL